MNKEIDEAEKLIKTRVTLAWARGILGLVKYREGWAFHLGVDESRVFMQLRFPVTCAVAGDEQTQHGRKWLLSPHMTSSELVLTAFGACRWAEEHECRERFLYKGQRVCGPHIDMDELAELLELGELNEDVRA